MKRFIKSKKGLALLATLVVAAAGAVAGYAYFTSTGNGAGSASVGTASNWSVGQMGAVAGGPLLPDPATGGPNTEVAAYTVKNNSAGNQKLNYVTIDIGDATNGPWSTAVGTNPACTKNDFALDGTATGNTVVDTWTQDLTAGQVVTGHVTLDMIDNGATQDSCQAATVPLYFSAS